MRRVAPVPFHLSCLAELLMISSRSHLSRAVTTLVARTDGRSRLDDSTRVPMCAYENPREFLRLRSSSRERASGGAVAILAASIRRLRPNCVRLWAPTSKGKTNHTLQPGGVRGGEAFSPMRGRRSTWNATASRCSRTQTMVKLQVRQRDGRHPRSAPANTQKSPRPRRLWAPYAGH
jgi:hypothetical protein